jgi:hypothetical protein
VRPAAIALPKKRGSWWVVVKYAERETDRVPVLGNGEEISQPSRIEEGVEISCVSENPCTKKTGNDAGPDCIAIANLEWKRNAWRITKRLPCPPAFVLKVPSVGDSHHSFR